MLRNRSNWRVLIFLLRPKGGCLGDRPEELLGNVKAAAEKMAEEERFELSEGFHPRWFSRPVHSTALPPLRGKVGNLTIISATVNKVFSNYAAAEIH